MDKSQEKIRRRRNADNRFASDYYYNSNQPNWTGQEEETNRRSYGLPSSFSRRISRTGDREYDYNRFGMGQGGTWNQRSDESYDFGEHNMDYSSDIENHRGKGPKGFTRTDDRIKEDINCRLTDDAYVDASNVEVGVENGEVTLTGSVPDRSSKRRAEDIVELVSGVSNVENRLRVK